MVTAAGLKSGFVIVDANGRLPVAPGETIRIKPAAGRLKIARVGKGGKSIPVEDVVAIASPKDGGDLVLLLDGHTRVVLDDFMKLCRKGSCDIELPDGKGGVVVIDGASHAIATGGDGSLLLHRAGDQATLSGLTDSFARYYDVLSQHAQATPEAGTAPSTFGGINPLVAAVGLAVAGGVALAAAGGGSDHQATPTPQPTPTPTPQPTADSVIHISAAAGPISAALSYQVIGADGTILATGTTDTAGMADVHISADYKGPILVRIMDANGTAADYSDEASGSALSLSTDMRAFAIMAGGDTSVSVTPLTELIARKLLEHQVGATLPDAATITEGTQAISQALGVDMSQGIVTVLDPAFNEADGISPAEAYGIFLAKLSGLDMKTGGIGQSLDTLASGITLQGSVAMLSPGSTILLQQGAAIFESGRNKDKAVLIPQDEPLAELPNAPLLLLTVGEQDITELLHAGVFTLDTKAAVGSQFQARMTLPDNATEGATIAVKAGDTVVGEWMVGLMDVVNGYADILLGTDFLAAPIEGRIAITAEITGMANARAASASLTIDTLAPPAPGLARDGSIVAVSNLQTGTSWSYSVDGGTSWTEGTGTSFTLEPGSYATGAIRARQTDQNGNAGTASSLAAADIADAPPSVTITSDRTTLDEGQTALITFTFSTVPIGFSLTDIVVTHGSVSDFTQTNNARVYTAIFTPQAEYEGSTTVAILADSWESGSGAGGTAAQSQPIAIDTSTHGTTPAAPTMTLVADTGAEIPDNVTSNGQIHIETSESAGQIQYSLNGGISWLDAASSTITLPAGIYEANAVRARVVVGSTIGAEATMPAVTVDTTAPSLTITSDKQSLAAGETATLTLTFDQAISGLSLENLHVGGGNLSDLVAAPSDPKVYTVVYTPTPGTTVTSAMLIVSGYHDIAGNAGQPQLSSPIALDLVGPGIASVTFASRSDNSNATLNAGDVVRFTVTFDEPIVIDTSGGIPYLTLAIGNTTRHAAYAETASAYALTFQYTIQDGDNDSDGISVDGSVGLTLNGATVRDQAGNEVRTAFESVGNYSAYAVDTIAPTLVGTSPVAGSAITANSPIVLTFSESVLRGAGTITISDGHNDTRTLALNDTQISLSGSTLTITPSTPLHENALYTVTIGAGTFVDSAGNAFAGVLPNAFGFSVRPEALSLTSLVSSGSAYGISGDAIFGNDLFGQSVAGIGDFNGDGLADAAIASKEGVYILFGGNSTTEIDVAAYRDGTASGGGLFLDAGSITSLHGPSVSSAGDLNGDGRSDILVGFADANGGFGRTYVIYGRSSSTPISLNAISAGMLGFAIEGDARHDDFGAGVAAAGDVNDDGYDDLLVGSPGHGGQGGAYILFGSSDGPFAQATSVEYDGSSNDDVFNSDGIDTTMMGRGGNDQIYMTGPDSVGYGGAGDDTFIVHSSFLGSLANPDPGAPRSSRIDGGSGIDTLKIALFSGDVTIDLRDLASGSATVDGDGRIESVEIVDLLAGEGQNSLWVTEESIIAMSSANAFVDDGRVQILVKGGLADTVNVRFLTDRPGYMIDGSIDYEGETYTTVRTDAVDIFVQQTVGIMVL